MNAFEHIDAEHDSQDVLQDPSISLIPEDDPRQSHTNSEEQESHVTDLHGRLAAHSQLLRHSAIVKCVLSQVSNHILSKELLLQRTYVHHVSFETP